MTDEFKEVLDRSGSVAAAKPLIEAACPLLREVVNHGTTAFVRVLRAKDVHGGLDEDLAAYVLYRHLLELADGVEVMFSQSVVDAAVPVVRAAFEASLSLDYILSDPNAYAQRSLCWLVGHMHGRLSAYDRLDSRSEAGSQYTRAFRDEMGDPLEGLLVQFDAKAHADRLRPVLSLPHFAAIEADYKRRKKEKKRREWFALMDGPANRQALAKAIGREAEYLSFYAEWSGFSHAADASRVVSPGRVPGEVAFLQLRTPHQMPHRAFMVVRWVIRGTRQMIDHFRPGERLDAWYAREVRDRWHALASLQATEGDNA